VGMAEIKRRRRTVEFNGTVSLMFSIGGEAEGFRQDARHLRVGSTLQLRIPREKARSASCRDAPHGVLRLEDCS